MEKYCKNNGGISRVYTAIKQAVSSAETWNYVRSTLRHRRGINSSFNGRNYAVKRSGRILSIHLVPLEKDLL